MSERQSLCAEILEDVRRVIAEELADAPSSLSEEGKAIENDLIGQTNRLFEALTLAEMRSVGAQCSYLASIRTEVQKRLCHGRR